MVEGSEPALETEPAHLLAAVREFFWPLGDKALDDLTVKETLGTGTFGRVRLVEADTLRKHLAARQPEPMSHATNCFLALKRMKKSEVVRLKQVEHILNEKSVLAETSHPFIVDMYATFQDERSLYMLLEYVPGGELFSHLRKAARFSNEGARFYAAQAVMAVQHLHGIGVVYRDLKPENMLLDGRGFLKLVDFGFAKRVADRTWTLCGTPEYLAPEIIQSKGHNFAVDWWALGIVIYEMLAGYPPFFDDSPFGIYQKILAGRHECPRHFEPTAKELIRKLLTADRTKRIGSTKNGGGAEEIKKQKWYRGLNWAALYNKTMEPYIAPDVSSSDDTSHYEKFADSIEESGPLLAITKDTALFGSFTGAFGSI
mmetsp:Transcript_23159/g.68664  ORF Transcript_23159/g.68664 Transcript_23159/m.68664 type:complete len:371 (-) Transcript_23159:54-1166(-)|eukprot:CAMPEP_0196668634 /NCGR_PEP_ID=MMETSP1090-20130531/29_1 /TAXON_ID=37098 /ORGANISM="Isochrysis sp, Strain CCMP1244" /LENGTH=370 /DNA_ID=CAMNT_0042006063 /DNA_START=76 /DNA_END=1188 /DNA_ORIENTATION=+